MKLTSPPADTKAKISIKLKPEHEAFCRYIFKTPTDQREITINRKHDIGKLITCNIITSDVPDNRPLTDSDVSFILPVNECTWLLTDKFVTLSTWGEQKIKDGIEYEFNLWLKRRYEIGYEMNMEQREIVEAVLRGLNMRNQVVNFDAIKKNDYRNRRKLEEIRFNRLLTGSYSA